MRYDSEPCHHTQHEAHAVSGAPFPKANAAGSRYGTRRSHETRPARGLLCTPSAGLSGSCRCTDTTSSRSPAGQPLLTAPASTRKLCVLYMTVRNNRSVCSGVLGAKLCIGKAIREQNKVVVRAANGQSTTIFYQDNLQQAQHLLTPRPGAASCEIFRNKYVTRSLNSRARRGL